jgi:hypothetical protein
MNNDNNLLSNLLDIALLARNANALTANHADFRNRLEVIRLEALRMLRDLINLEPLGK